MPIYPSDEDQLIVTGLFLLYFVLELMNRVNLSGLKDGEKRNIYADC